MKQHSAGVLLYRRRETGVEVLLVHPGGPLWRKRDAGAWQLPKGLVEEGEDPARAAVRECEEELGIVLEDVAQPLCRIRQAGGKWVDAFMLEQDIDPAAIRSNVFEMEWPPRSGRRQSFPEVDRAAWFALDEAHAVILASQRPVLDNFAAHIAGL